MARKIDDPAWRRDRARAAHRARYDPEYRRERKAAAAARYIRELVDTFPPLTAEQRERLAALLEGGARGGP